MNLSQHYLDKFMIENAYVTAWSNTDLADFNVRFSCGIFFNSSESRATEYSEVLKPDSIEYGLLIDFCDHNQVSLSSNDEANCLKIKNLEVNKTKLRAICKEIDILTISDIFNYAENIKVILASIPESLFRLDSNFFIDITGTPLIYSSAILKLLKDRFPSPKVYMLNVHAHYESSGTKQFSDGTRSDIYIPGYYGGVDHNKPTLFIFLIGFEGSRSLKILQENEPDEAIVIVADPGYEKANAEFSLVKNSHFLMEVGIDVQDNSIAQKRLIRLPIYDIGKVCETIIKIYSDHKDRYSIRLVPLGPKPHAIGAALAAICQPEMSVMYQVPKKYVLSETKSSGEYWLYRINE